jgi:triacylglycerol lipase
MSLAEPMLTSLPRHRVAYSDRTAWLLAELSMLAYEHYEREAWNIEGLAASLAGLADVAAIRERLQVFREQVRNPLGQGKLAFERKLEPGGFRLAAIFDHADTQGYLAVRDGDGFAVLVFRGTEKNMNDIRTDITAWQDRGGAHSGFRIAYDGVKEQVLAALGDVGEFRLYLTGHSLGGALAMMAAHHLSRSRRTDIGERIAACYTFGGPKIGDREFTAAIKPPIYRVVHNADIVPWLPVNLSQLFAVLAWFGRFLPWQPASEGIYRWLSRHFNHVHHGDLRWLAGGEVAGDEPFVIPNPGVVEQMLRIVPRILADRRRLYTDHRIAAYCDRLEAYARGRNPPATAR